MRAQQHFRDMFDINTTNGVPSIWKQVPQGAVGDRSDDRYQHFYQDQNEQSIIISHLARIA